MGSRSISVYPVLVAPFSVQPSCDLCVSPAPSHDLHHHHPSDLHHSLHRRPQVPSLVKGIHRQLRERSTKTRQGCFSLLRELILVLKGALTDHVGMLMPGIQYSLG